MSGFDYKMLGLKCGLEIHQELESTRKLFCYCPSILQTGEPDFYIKRDFRPVLGEMGKFDEAMLVEYEKRLTVIYEGYNQVCCSYEMDETPPFEIDKKALETGLKVGLLLNLNLYTELYVCRKNYLDGSVPCGFQRTLLIGSDGHLEVENKRIGINTISIEEDAARKIKEEEKTVTYRLDRLGIPLIELVTDPDIHDPEECMNVAFQLGKLLRSTGLMKRGLGTIRQDVNVSIEGGARVEIKGVQKLEWIPSLIDSEARRQLNLLKIQNELNARNFTKEDLLYEFQDVTEIFINTTSRFIKEGINAGQKVFAVKVPKIAGILGIEVMAGKGEERGVRFGGEIAQKVSAITGIKGIIHSDEDMNKYGFKGPMIASLRESLVMNEDDLFILILGAEEKAKKALKIAIDRIGLAILGVPNETRKALENFNSEFIREMHGGARLYPDTDTMPIQLKNEYFEELNKNLPELPRVIEARLKQNYELDESTIDKLILQGYTKLFEEIVTKFEINPTLVTTTLLETLKSIKREGFESEEITEQHLRDLFEMIHQQEISKEAIEDILKVVTQNATLTIKQAKEQLDLKSVSLEEVDSIIYDILKQSDPLLKEKRERAFSPLMGEVMKVLRGKVDGKILATKLRESINNYLEEG